MVAKVAIGLSCLAAFMALACVKQPTLSASPTPAAPTALPAQSVTCPATADGAAASDALARSGAPLAAPLGSLRERDAIAQELLQLRLEQVLPRVMRRHGVDMWIVASRENNEDPVFFSLASPGTMAARRRTIFVFFDRGESVGVERLALGGGSHGGLYEVHGDPHNAGREIWGATQWQHLRKLIDERKPKRIAIDVSDTHAFADGLTSSQRQALEQALGPWRKRLRPAEALAVEYISTRVPQMLPHYRRLMQVAHDIIARAFSNEVITPGVTTTEDVEWWMRERVRALGFGEWFFPDVDVQRPGVALEGYLASDDAVTIQRGDVLHCDFGMVAIGMATDTQHLGYVLREGEAEVPAGLRKAMAVGNRLQDIVMSHMQVGRTGNEVLKHALAQMRDEGIDGTIYTHAIGDHGHGAGPLVGLWDQQEGVAGIGELKLLPNTWFSIELQATSPVAEWGGQPVRAALEEDAAIDDNGDIAWVLPRQTAFHVVR